MLRCLIFLILGFGSLSSAAPPSAPWFPKAPPLPNAEGPVIRVANVKELFTAAKSVKPGTTILLADGRYMMPVYLGIETDNVTLRGESGDRHKVILDGSSSRHGELLGISRCQGVTIADLTIENIKRGNSNIRNPILASYATKILPYRGLGSGIIRALRAYSDIEFEDDHDGNQFKAIIKRRTLSVEA